MTKTRLVASLLVAASLTATLAPTKAARADGPSPSSEAIKDAGKHFQRGVALFNEADYAGALVEFKRANEIAPNVAVLYNIAQTHFQLRSYAAALQTFERFLAESPSTADHRAEVESTIETLRSRVGKIDVTAPDGSEISIDDEVVGRAPLPPVLAAVGKRKVIATTREGRATAPRIVEVSAGEVTKIELKVDTGAPAASPQAPAGSTSSERPPKEPSGGSALPVVLWIGAGALAAGAVTTGILSMGASNDLADERKKVPTSRASLDDLQEKTKTLALVTDILGASAIVVGGVALYLTLSSSSSSSSASSSPSTIKLRLAGSRATLEGSF